MALAGIDHRRLELKERDRMMVYGGGWEIGLVGLALSVGIFAVLCFTAIKRTTDTANDAIRTGLQQSQQQLNSAKKDAPTPEARHRLSRPRS